VVEGEVLVDALEASLRGRPGRRLGWGAGWSASGAPVGAATAAMAAAVGMLVCGAAVGSAAAAAIKASTSGRHRMRLRDPGGRPLGRGSLVLKVGELGVLFGGGYGGGEDAVMGVWKEVAEASSSVEWKVQGVGVDGLFDAAGHPIALPGEVGDVVRAEVVACSSGVLPNGRGIIVGQR
jgi:hypothetical protein